jgi:hypothetical protein
MANEFWLIGNIPWLNVKLGMRFSSVVRAIVRMILRQFIMLGL